MPTSIPSLRGAASGSVAPLLDEGSAALLLKCVDFVSDILLITEAAPIDHPGPRVVFANQAFERTTGYSVGEIIGQTPRVLQGPKTNRAELRRIREALANEEQIRAELVNYKKNGEEFHVEMDIVAVRDEQGRLTHWVSIQRDVTVRNKTEAEARARASQRFDSLGTLAAGIAHDFNNIIAAILGNVAIGTLDLKSGQMPNASLEQIRIAALRARSVVAKILAYGRRRADATVPLQLEPIVREATDLLRATLPAGVRLEVSYPPEPLWIRGDASQLSQVLLNLGVNALQALRGGNGLIHFALGAPSKFGAAVPGYASIEVCDTGVGMSADIQARMFEPYFTTKEAGSGTGLGLSVVWGIVAAHQGTIAVQSKPGQGSCIKLSLPLVAETLAGPPIAIEPTIVGAFGSGEHVLVVDDDEVVVVMLEGMLKRWGFRVTSIQDPLHAVDRIKRMPGEFDAVITDLNMPNISGLEVARAMLTVRRDMPVLLCSGNVSEELVDAASRVGVAAVFPKEFAVEQLGPLLRHALETVSSRVG